MAGVLALVVVASACDGPRTIDFGPGPAASATAPASRTEAVAGSPTPQPTRDPAAACVDCWPLNGMPTKNGQVARTPLLVKIDNAPAARPHYGIAQADMVFEALVEGGVTRLAAVFHSQDPATIGGVRSARLVDRSLTAMVRGALVYSGTSDYAWSLISKDAALGRYIELSADHSGGYYRVNFRAAPYNLFTSAAAQRQVLRTIGYETATDIPTWGFLASADHPSAIAGMSGAVAAAEITIPYRADTSLVSYQYDAASRTYARYQNTGGKPVREVDALTNKAIAATDVVIIRTDIWDVPEIVDAAGSVSNDMRLTGSGSATIFRDGLRQEATWSRKDDYAPFVFTNPEGEPILLSPGQAWVHVIPLEMTVGSR